MVRLFSLMWLYLSFAVRPLCATEMDTRLLVVNVLVALVMPCYGHVGLYFPPARTYALDFLDSARTKWPCGMARGTLSLLTVIITVVVVIII